ncbi:hypothetical protein BYT27DRAFT_7340101 [Phlegmacium glaucopus]|nr:hypothetical protein BYT27DRAFT_7340101 [Phlegmacium glaucopus]
MRRVYGGNALQEEEGDDWVHFIDKWEREDDEDEDAYVFLESSSPHHLNDGLTLAIIRSDDLQSLRLTKISTTKWKAAENIVLYHDAADVTDVSLIVHSKDGGDEAFLAFSADDIYAMVCAGEGTPVEHVFTCLKDEDPITVKMTSTVAISGAQAFERRFAQTQSIADITQVISHYESATSSVPPDGELDVLPFIFYKLGNLYLLRFELTGNVQDIDLAISHNHSAVNSTPCGDAGLPDRFNCLGKSYICRFERTRNHQDIDHAISHFQSAVKLTPSDHAELPGWINDLGSLELTPGNANLPVCFSNLGNSYIYRFKHSREPQDINHAISQHQSAIKLTPSGHADLPEMFNCLGISYRYRFDVTGDLEDISHAISHQQRAVESSPSDNADLPGWFSDLGNSYAKHFEHTGNLQDIDCAISHFQMTVKSTPSRHDDLPNRLNDLGDAYSRRFNSSGNLEDLDHAISHFQRAVDYTTVGRVLPSQFNNLGNFNAVNSNPPDHANYPVHISDLGRSYMMRFEHTGNLQDIDHAISHLQRAVESTPSDHESIPACVSDLGTSYLCRFEHTGNLEDIDHAISNHRKAVESSPPNHANLPHLLNNLGTSYSGRFQQTGDLQDIDCAVSYQQIAVQSTPFGHAGLPSYLNNLGISFARRFKRTGDLQDIDQAISHEQSAVDSTPSGHPDLSGLLTNLGTAHLRRFGCTGDLQDLDHAISHHQSATKSAPPDHAKLPIMFSNLACSYESRFQRTGDLQDIDHAISHHQTAVKLTPSGHANLAASRDVDRGIAYHQKAFEATPSGHANVPTFFSSLGNSYLDRFKHTGDVRDIDRALSHLQSALKLTPSGHADLPGRFESLGKSYRSRFELTRELHDIERAISNHLSAIESTPSSHASLPGRLNNIGNSYRTSFEVTGKLEDIDCAISYQQKAAQSVPSGHADIPAYLKNLGDSYLLRFRNTHHFPDVKNSHASYRRAAEANGAPSIQVAGMEQTIHSRHANLQEHSKFALFAVATALQCNRVDLALEWLEEGRCLVWNQLNQLRTPIDELRVKSPSLANRFIEVARALESYGTRPEVGFTTDTLTEDIRLQDDTRNHTVHATEYKQLLKEIRDLPDFHDFLQPRKAGHLLSSLPPDGPIVIFSIARARCDALALMAGMEEPLHIPLENFSLKEAERLQKTIQMKDYDSERLKEPEEDHHRLPLRVSPTSSSIPHVLNELWCKVVQPILEALGYSSKSPPNLSDRHRIWWCPTGPLVFLPLHAAGVYGSEYQRGSCASDFIVSSYTPTVRSVNDKFIASSASSLCTRVVLISQPNTPGLSSIPSARTETHALKSLMEETAVEALLLEDSNATKEKVKEEMMSSSWVHFACHGVQDVEQPLESGLCVHDGRLELLEIMKQQMPNPVFAYSLVCL